MKEWLIFATEKAVIAIDAMALVVIVIGTIEAFVSALRAMFSSPKGHERRDIWLRFGRWLIAGLTFQLAADVIETSITTSWQAVARLGAIAQPTMVPSIRRGRTAQRHPIDQKR